jgi:hypothetical protein
MNYLAGLGTLLKAVSDVLTAGVAIIAFSLLVYAVTFRQHDRVAVTFTLLLISIVIIFGADAFATVSIGEEQLRFILKIHWFGLIFLPTTYFLFSDALLTMTGRPSRGRRNLVGLMCILISCLFGALLLTNRLMGNVIANRPPAPYLERTTLIDLFTAFFVSAMALSWYNYIRAYQRTITKTSRRRMLYLIGGALGPAFGSFPYLLYGSNFASHATYIFWTLSILSNAAVYVTLIMMTYAVSFHGFPWADRVIKSRLFRWVMRGPVTASLTLGVTTIITRLGRALEINVSSILVLAMVAVIVLFEYSVTLFARVWERVMFRGNEREELEKIRSLEDRLLTSNDVRQFIDLILATLCDLLQVQGACLLTRNGNNGNAFNIQVGKLAIDCVQEKAGIYSFFEAQAAAPEDVFIKREPDTYLLPIVFLAEDQSNETLGIIVIEGLDLARFDEGKKRSIHRLVSRTALALHDREIQENLFVSLEMLTPQVSIIQDLLATSRANQNKIMSENPTVDATDFEQWVKDALDHMWGGPKLSQNPILQLKIVEQKAVAEKETPVNALREILRWAIQKLKPEGERQFTNEWILYNLLELKYLSGWKVKDIARKLALSEADLYRKQRIAISAVSQEIIDMEKSNLIES